MTPDASRKGVSKALDRARARAAAGNPPLGAAVGLDLGATLIKLAIRNGPDDVAFELHPASNVAGVAERVASLSPTAIGLTGAGATGLAEALAAGSGGERPLPEPVRALEFEAWRLGALELLGPRSGAVGSATGEAPSTRDRLLAGDALLVSIGTGTSVLRLEGDETVRVGGTALGGGTILGLGQVLAGTSDFDALCKLASEGERGSIDLRLADIYAPDELPLPGALTAASFAKLARNPGTQPKPADLVAAVMGIVGENVGFICAHLATAQGVDHIVYGGTTLRNNPTVIALLEVLTRASGHTAVFLEDGEFAGALGALELAS